MSPNHQSVDIGGGTLWWQPMGTVMALDTWFSFILQRTQKWGDFIYSWKHATHNHSLHLEFLLWVVRLIWWAQWWEDRWEVPHKDGNCPEQAFGAVGLTAIHPAYRDRVGHRVGARYFLNKWAKEIIEVPACCAKFGVGHPSRVV